MKHVQPKTDRRRVKAYCGPHHDSALQPTYSAPAARPIRMCHDVSIFLAPDPVQQSYNEIRGVYEEQCSALGSYNKPFSNTYNPG
ncbi:hypothetical protein L484_025219 [Morus notabilis]|uniref:Uncharacterized protein n=1 Tax=Morus notabilis TaxID=981085 RepID=W9S4S9_9ROSA|nr:hypothetical protein L484_025219 [Morus notabilis]